MRPGPRRKFMRQKGRPFMPVILLMLELEASSTLRIASLTAAMTMSWSIFDVFRVNGVRVYLDSSELALAAHCGLYRRRHRPWP